MDLYVERQCVDEMKGGNAKRFLMLFEANFAELYKYVARRVEDRKERDRIVRLTFLDALGQIQNTPNDVTYLVWLYSLAKPRVWDYIAKKSGAVSEVETGKNEEFLLKAGKMMNKLSLEEREILRLKFFEQVADGDVMVVLGMEEGSIGPKIYRVLKRAHFLLFGESDERKGVYFGELSGFFERWRGVEKIEVPEVLKLNLKLDLEKKIQRKDFAVDVEVVEEKKTPFSARTKGPDAKKPTGSNDPAKIFVEAVKEMRAEEEIEKQRAREKFEKSEKRMDFIDRWKSMLALIPVVLFGVVFAFVLINFLDFKIERGYPTTCDMKVVFEGNFSDGEKRSVISGISNKLCDHFEVESLKIARNDDGILDVEVDVPDWFLEYKFVKKTSDWRIKKYARTFNSDGESGQVWGNSGGAFRAIV